MNPKITIDADLGGAQDEIEEFRKELAELKKEMSSDSGKTRFETEFQAAGNALDKLIQKYEKLLQKLDGVDKSSKKYAEQLKEIAKLNLEAAKISSKIEDMGSLSSNRSGYFMDEAAANREDQSRVLAEIRHQGELDRQQARVDADRGRWADKATKLAGVIGGSLLGGGNVGSTVGAAVGGGIGSGIGAVLSAVPGAGKILSVLGSALGGAVGGAADGQYPSVKQEAILYTNLRHAIGSTKTDFDKLRDTVRATTDGLGVTYNEAAKMADTFARVSGSQDIEDIAGSVKTGASFSRNFGIDPNAGTGFLASMRLMGATRNDADQRKLASMIGESVSKTGTSGKVDQIMSALQGFASGSAKTLIAQNVQDYLSNLTSLMGSSSAGMRGNPNTAAAMLDQANSAVMGGGAMGAASQSYIMQAFNRRNLGMNAMEIQFAYEAGAYTPLSSTFGKESPLYKAAQSQGDKTALSRYDRYAKSKLTPRDVIMESINAEYGNDTVGKIGALKGMMGFTGAQAAEFMSIKPTPLTGKGFEGAAKYKADDQGAKYMEADAAFKNELQKVMTGLLTVETEAKSILADSLKHLQNIDEVFTGKKDAQGNKIREIAPDGKPVRSFDDLKGGPTLPEKLKEWKDKLMTPSLSPQQKEIAGKVAAEAERQGIDPKLAMALALKESSLDPKARGKVVTSGMHTGDRAAGVFQYMAKSSEGWNRFDVDENIKHGVADLKGNLDKFGGREDLAIAAHLTGPNNKQLKKGMIPAASDGSSTAADYVKSVKRNKAAFEKMMESKNSTMSAKGKSADWINNLQVKRVDNPSVEGRGISNADSDSSKAVPDWVNSLQVRQIDKQMDAKQINNDQASKTLKAQINGTFVLNDNSGTQIADPVSISQSFPSPVPGFMQ